MCLKLGFAGGCADQELPEVVWPSQLERRLSTWTIPVPNEAILVNVFTHVARGRPQFVPASGHPELRSGVRLLARLGPTECGCRTLDVLPVFMRYDGWP